jgi:hypothetical protein
MIDYDGRRGHPPDRTAPRRGRRRRLRLTDAELVRLAMARPRYCWGSTASTAGIRFAYCRLGHLFHYLPNQPGSGEPADWTGLPCSPGRPSGWS